MYKLPLIIKVSETIKTKSEAASRGREEDKTTHSSLLVKENLCSCRIMSECMRREKDNLMKFTLGERYNKVCRGHWLRPMEIIL